MFLSELMMRAMYLGRPTKRGKLPAKKPFRMGRSAKGLVAIPNKIRKRMSGAKR